MMVVIIIIVVFDIIIQVNLEGGTLVPLGGLEGVLGLEFV